MDDPRRYCGVGHLRRVLPAVALLLSLGCDGNDPTLPTGVLLHSLTMTVTVEPSSAVAGDQVEAVVRVTNPNTDGLTLTGEEACLVSDIKVHRRIGDEWEPVDLTGTGDQPCPAGSSLTVPGQESVTIRAPFQVWQQVSPLDPPSLGGPPIPGTYRIGVRSDPLEVFVEATFGIAPSGYWQGLSRTCASSPPGGDEVSWILDAEVFPGGSGRIRFEVHNGTDETVSFYRCDGRVHTVLDRWVDDGWELGTGSFCTMGNETGGDGIPPGQCVRSFKTFTHSAELYRLRLSSGGEGGLESPTFSPVIHTAPGPGGQ